ncbi:hypothetical protein [Tateyamaria sp. ANG-S1]|uniref:hypothetical protein n=1 Tax=Tateyamaria sp. ANG-S1 TaxID=1577905 RepID=UPI00057D3121|nr:hypothetical protein [Tateyamaria sp. ANG-S1]KIC48973.1 hypothetical protein RA29_15080 [Tateyamaria sp. ANG-S1]
MKPGQSTFDERVTRINKGHTLNARDVVVTKPKLIHQSRSARRVHLDMLAAGGIAGAIAGMLFASNIGFLFLITLDYTTLYGLLAADMMMAACIAAVVMGPLGFLWTLILSRTAKRALQFWTAYCAGVLALNATDLRYWAETTAIPAFWQFMENYTAATNAV